MEIEISEEELICLLFWYMVFRDTVDISLDEYVTDKSLFEKLKMRLNLRKERFSVWEEFFTKIPPVKRNDKT